MRLCALFQLIESSDLLPRMFAHEFDIVQRFRIAAGIDEQPRSLDAQRQVIRFELDLLSNLFDSQIGRCAKLINELLHLRAVRVTQQKAVEHTNRTFAIAAPHFRICERNCSVFGVRAVVVDVGQRIYGCFLCSHPGEHPTVFELQVRRRLLLQKFRVRTLCRIELRRPRETSRVTQPQVAGLQRRWKVAIDVGRSGVTAGLVIRVGECELVLIRCSRPMRIRFRLGDFALTDVANPIQCLISNCFRVRVIRIRREQFLSDRLRFVETAGLNVQSPQIELLGARGRSVADCSFEWGDL